MAGTDADAGMHEQRTPARVSDCPRLGLEEQTSDGFGPCENFVQRAYVLCPPRRPFCPSLCLFIVRLCLRTVLMLWGMGSRTVLESKHVLRDDCFANVPPSLSNDPLQLLALLFTCEWSPYCFHCANQTSHICHTTPKLLYPTVCTLWSPLHRHFSAL